MAETTFVAFKWTGTWYNATYTETHTATIRDDDAAYEGQSDSDEKISVDGGAFQASQSNPYSIVIDFTTADGADKEEAFSFFKTGGNWYFIPGPDSEFDVGSKLGSYQSHTNGWTYASAVCFVDGTRIDTGTGPVAVEDIRPGDLIRTAEGGLRPLRQVLVRRVSAMEQALHPTLIPIVVGAGALGEALPRDDLRVSRQHRLMLRSAIARRVAGNAEVLVPAHRLVGCPGIRSDTARRDVSYYHLVFDRHEVVLANGAPAESLFPGAEALKSMPQPQREELVALFPELDAVPLARPVPTPERQKQIVARHIRALRPFVEEGQPWSRAG